MSGDDYHKWPRGHQSWNRITHLNPQGNDLHLPIEHIEHLKKGNIISKRHYDHTTGNFSDPETIEPKRFNLFVGLHPFYLPRMRAMLDLKIFMETDERVRTAWKIARDSQVRGYSVEQVVDQIEGRRGDGLRFIEPQKGFADLVIRYLPKSSSKPLPPEATETEAFDRTELAVEYTFSSDIEVEPLLERLEQLPSLNVQWSYLEDLRRQQIYCEGSVEPEDLNRHRFGVVSESR